MKVVLVPDSFKGTMSSKDICVTMSDAIKSVLPDAEIISIPVADGGEGTVDSFVEALAGEKVYLNVKGPHSENIESYYGVCGKTAVVEMAAAAGLPLVGDKLLPDITTTFGVGQLILHALENELIDTIVIGLGGSATNDGGCGAAAAVGVKFYDKNDTEFIPVGGTLKDICRIDASCVHGRLSKVKIISMCDIDNPLCGEDGASAVFGPQKGATTEMVAMLDDGLMHLSNKVEHDLGTSILNLPGAGSAGGMGGGMVAFFKAELKMGIDVVLDTVNFEDVIRDSDMILTGEGRIDGQSLCGKVVVGVARRAKKSSIPTIAIVGDISVGAERAYAEGLSGIFTINRLAVPYAKAKTTAKEDLYFTVANLLKCSCALRKSLL